MAGNVSNWVWEHSRAVNASLIVLLAIAHAANRDGEAEMSIIELAAKCRLGRRTVQAALPELVASGELSAAAGGGRGHRARYQVIMVKGADPAPFTGPKGADPAPFTGLPASKGAGSAPFTADLKGADPAPFRQHHHRSEHTSDLKGADPAPFETSDVFKRSTGREEVQVKETSAKPQRRPDADRLCEHLADRIEANGSKRPTITRRWRDAARLMLDNDGRTEQQITAAIDWCQKNEFWRANILSMPKLREKYDQLRLEAMRVNGNGRKSTTTDRVQQATEAGRRVQAMLNGDA